RQVQELVRFDGVGAERLQRVRANLVRQADAAALLPQVQEHAGPAARDLRLRALELLAAIALHRPEHFARQTFRVHPHWNAATATNVTEDERAMFLAERWMNIGVVPAIDAELKWAVSGRKGGAREELELRGIGLGALW